ncbi:agmatine deiminase [Photobacterium sp. MCCC 1A19761]|uniref:agmatine deiminase n=1 Tax=Photobacterium sp. MCCC 1A19761 TaxID=3115000 RepID=UPI00307D4E17
MEQAGTPKQDGFYFPAEFQPQQAVWLAWPERPDNWRDGAKPAQRVFAEIAEVLSQVVAVTVVVTAAQYAQARAVLGEAITVVEMAYNDAWMRDIGPTALLNDHGELRTVSWRFNAWGGHHSGLYSPWEQDDRVAVKVSKLLGVDHYQAPFVLEGGAIHSDGEGTLYVTEECLLHENRNPHLTREALAQQLAEYLNIEKIIWIPRGLYNDETNGHVDNLLHVIAPGEVVLTWTDDPTDPQYEISRQAYAALIAEPDARGQTVKVHKLPMPGPLYLSESEAAGIEASQGMKRQAGERLAASYCNFLMINRTVIFPLLDPRTDEAAKAVLQAALPDWRIIGIPTREVLLGGGNIHCITQQIPVSRA